MVEGECRKGCIEETSCPPYQLLCRVITLLLFRDLVNKAIEEIVHQCIGSSVSFEFNNSFNFGVIFKLLKYVSRTLYIAICARTSWPSANLVQKWCTAVIISSGNVWKCVGLQ